MVGESGPELLWTDPGARVVPLDHSTAPGLMEHSLTADVPIVVKLDSKVLTEAIARIKLSQRARA
jgi:hypothetical protein